PGQPPYTRGNHPVAPLWSIAQQIPYTTPEAFNAALRNDLERGQDAINLEGVSFSSLDDLKRVFDGVDLTHYPIIASSIPNALSFVRLLSDYLGQGIAELRGCIASDPLSELARTGVLADNAYDDMAQLT